MRKKHIRSIDNIIDFSALARVGSLCPVPTIPVIFWIIGEGFLTCLCPSLKSRQS